MNKVFQLKANCPLSNKSLGYLAKKFEQVGGDPQVNKVV